MRRKGFIGILIVLLLFSVTLTGCKPKRDLKGLENHLIEAGYSEKSFVLMDNIVVKALLKIVGMKGIMAYNDGSTIFVVFEMKEEKPEGDVIDATLSILSQMNLNDFADIPELSAVIQQLTESKEKARDYLKVNTTFVLLHDNQHPELLAAYMSY